MGNGLFLQINTSQLNATQRLFPQVKNKLQWLLMINALRKETTETLMGCEKNTCAIQPSPRKFLAKTIAYSIKPRAERYEYKMA